MQVVLASSIMPRTTINIDAPVLRDLKRLQKRTGQPLGRLVSDLLARALGQEADRNLPAAPFRWISRPMGARVDLADKEALRAALDADARGARTR
jgi:hypothetical protein